MEEMALGTDRWAEESEDRHPPTPSLREPLWEPGPLGLQLLAVRDHSYSTPTWDLAVLPETGPVTEEGLAKSLCEWEPLTDGVTISVLLGKLETLLSLSPCLLAT